MNIEKKDLYPNYVKMDDDFKQKMAVDVELCTESVDNVNWLMLSDQADVW